MSIHEGNESHTDDDKPLASQHREMALDIEHESDTSDDYPLSVQQLMAAEALMHAVLYVGDQLRLANELTMMQMEKKK